MQNSTLAGILGSASQGVVSAIKQASTKTGVDFAYLVQQAKAESSFNPTAKAKTSSASGLYQFIESTWLSMVKSHGEKHGIQTDGKSREEILALRNDPEKASAMAAEFAGENQRFLKTHWGGEIGSTELYFAHFLGAPKAASFLKAKDENPSQPAAYLFPKAAKANRNVFYDRTTGRAKSMDEVYAFFDRKFSVNGSGGTNGPTSADTLMARTRPPVSSDANNQIMAQTGVPSSAPVPLSKPSFAGAKGEVMNNTEEQQATARASVVFRNYNAIHERDRASLAAQAPVQKAGALWRAPHNTSAPFYNSLGSFQSLVSNPIEIILLAQLDSPYNRQD